MNDDLTVRCICRLSDGSEWFPAKYSVKRNVIVGFEEFLDLSGLPPKYITCSPNNFIIHNEITPGQMYRNFSNYGEFIVVIDFESIGEVLLRKTDAFKHIEANGVLSENVKLEKPVHNFEVKEIATLKSPIYSYSIQQPKLNIGCIEYHNRVISLTRYGVIDVPDAMLDCKPTMKNYLRMFDFENVYGICEKAGKTYFVILDDNEIRRFKLKEVI